jgi:hypothetical protein
MIAKSKIGNKIVYSKTVNQNLQCTCIIGKTAFSEMLGVRRSSGWIIKAIPGVL